MFFDKIKDVFTKNFQQIFNRTDNVDELLEELEETLILCDIGVNVSLKVCDELRKKFRGQKSIDIEQLKQALREELIEILNSTNRLESGENEAILVVGVNGVGKTTTIAKLANLFKNDKNKVILVAADTFRAGAVEQLKIWGDRVAVDVVSRKGTGRSSFSCV